MAATDSFRKRHADLLAVAGEIGKMLDPAQLAKNASQARMLLSGLAGKLKVHLAMEDKTLYPRLMRDPDPQVGGLAKRFADEMGGIAEVFAALATRIERENNQIYPLLDQRG